MPGRIDSSRCEGISLPRLSEPRADDRSRFGRTGTPLVRIASACRNSRKKETAGGQDRCRLTGPLRAAYRKSDSNYGAIALALARYRKHLSMGRENGPAPSNPGSEADPGALA